VTDTTLGLVWGARAIGAVIGRTERQTHYLLESGAIRAARKAGPNPRSQWCASITGLREQFVNEPRAEAEHDTAA
jgi:hypothetical protein